MLHSPELMLLLHNVDQGDLYREFRGRSRGARPGPVRRGWSALARALAARAALARRSQRQSIAPDCVGPCVA